MSEEKTLYKMANTPINKLMISIGLPMMVSMVLQALYNIVDSAFVSNMENGEAALNALTLAFPIQMFMVAIAIGTGVGANALLSKTLGQQNRKKAGYVAGNAIFLGIVISVLFMLFGIYLVPLYISTQTANAEIYKMAIEYLRICCIISFGIVFFSVFEKLLQATGLSLYSTIGQISGAVINIILDPILIYGLFGFLKMGVTGAALATVIGQIASFFLVLVFHFKFNKAVPKGIKYLKPCGNIIKSIYSIGFPAIIAQALMSFMTYGINIILVKVSEGLVTAYGLYYKIQQFVLFAAFGLRDAITPIVSYNHGMGSGKRVKEGINCGVRYTLIIMLTGTLLLEIFANSLTGIFSLSGMTEQYCISAMHIISISFVFAGVNIALQGVFQALDGGIESLIISVLRQFLLVLPLAYIFTLLVNESTSNAWIIWLTFPIAEMLSAVVSILFMKRIDKKTISKLK